MHAPYDLYFEMSDTKLFLGKSVNEKKILVLDIFDKSMHAFARTKTQAHDDMLSIDTQQRPAPSKRNHLDRHSTKNM